MLQTFTATLSAVDPADNVTERRFHVVDKNANETVVILTATETSVTATFDDTLAPGSCYLIDINAAGSSQPSPPAALVPPVTPPPPPPPPGAVPKMPAVTAVTWAVPS